MKKNKIMLNKNNEFFKDLVEKTADIVIRLDHKGRLLYLSPLDEKKFGVKPLQCIGKKALSFVHKDDRRNTLEKFTDWLCNKPVTANIENRIITATGRALNFIWSVCLYYDPSGYFSGIAATGKDITPINNKMKKLQKKEKIWSRLFMDSPTWMLLVTLEEGKFIDVNDAGCKDMGYTKKDIIGRTSTEIGLWPDKKERNHYLSLIKKRNRLDKLPVKFKMRDGKIRDYLWSTTVIEMEREKCLLSVLVDVSKLKKTEKKLDKINKKLQQRSNKLSEVNVALKVLLNQRDEDKKQIESNVWHNIKKMIQPHLKNLKVTDLNPLQHAHLDVVINRLDEITSSIGEKMGHNNYALSFRELEVAGHIIVGKANKEIAEILCISVHSVESHRFSIRKKIGILGSRTNLRTHLLSLSDHVDNKGLDITK